MKVNFKKIITAIAATAMCAVPMAGSLSANAASIDRIDRGNIRIEKAELGRLERKPVEPPVTGPRIIEKIDKSQIEYNDKVLDYIRAQKVEEEAKKLRAKGNSKWYSLTAIYSSDDDSTDDGNE